MEMFFLVGLNLNLNLDAPLFRVSPVYDKGTLIYPLSGGHSKLTVKKNPPSRTFGIVETNHNNKRCLITSYFKNMYIGA